MQERIGEFTFSAPVIGRDREILSDEALQFLSRLVRNFRAQRNETLVTWSERRTAMQAGALPIGFRSDEGSRRIRDDASWTVSPLPDVFWEPGVEITGPSGDRKGALYRFNSGPVMTMEDFEDSQSPTWRNTLDGQVNVYDAARHTLSLEHPQKGTLTMNADAATLLVRPRGLHLDEWHVRLDGKTVPASLFDFGLFVFHNAQELLNRGSGPYLYLPKLEGVNGAIFWDDVFEWTENELGIPVGSIKATVLIEHPLGMFDADEILHALRRHSAGLNVGRWDYLGALERLLVNVLFPDRGQIDMNAPCMNSYVDYVGYVCYRRSAPFVGGMEAQIPVKNNPEFSNAQLEKARRGKEREALEKGCVRAWVAHPDMVKPISDIFTSRRSGWQDVAWERYRSLYALRPPQPKDFLTPPPGTITEDGVRENLSAILLYLANWTDGIGAAAIDYYDASDRLLKKLMDDLATVQISHAQEIKRLRLRASLSDGRPVVPRLVLNTLYDEVERMFRRGQASRKNPKFESAVRLVEQLLLNPDRNGTEYIPNMASVRELLLAQEAVK